MTSGIFNGTVAIDVAELADTVAIRVAGRIGETINHHRITSALKNFTDAAV